jgi:hypothetical protein
MTPLSPCVGKWCAERAITECRQEREAVVTIGTRDLSGQRKRREQRHANCSVALRLGLNHEVREGRHRYNRFAREAGWSAASPGRGAVGAVLAGDGLLLQRRCPRDPTSASSLDRTSYVEPDVAIGYPGLACSFYVSPFGIAFTTKVSVRECDHVKLPFLGAA